MGNKTDYVSTAKLRNVLVDFSIADPADKDAEDHGATSAIQVRKARAWLEEVTGGTTGRHRCQPSWAQRVLSWFKSRFGQSDLR